MQVSKNSRGFSKMIWRGQSLPRGLFFLEVSVPFLEVALSPVRKALSSVFGFTLFL